MLNALKALFRSRKFTLLLFDTIVSLALYYRFADPQLIAILQPVFLAAIGGIAYEDGQAKALPRQFQQTNISTDAPPSAS